MPKIHHYPSFWFFSSLFFSVRFFCTDILLFPKGCVSGFWPSVLLFMLSLSCHYSSYFILFVHACNKIIFILVRNCLIVWQFNFFLLFFCQATHKMCWNIKVIKLWAVTIILWPKMQLWNLLLVNKGML